MKYRLKKDLPFAKAGTEIINSLNPYGTYVYGNVINNGISNRDQIYLGEVETLLNNGWIEEVKPREWYISKHAIRDYARENIEAFSFIDERKDLIKIKEVIE